MNGEWQIKGYRKKMCFWNDSTQNQRNEISELLQKFYDPKSVEEVVGIKFFKLGVSIRISQWQNCEKLTHLHSPYQ